MNTMMAVVGSVLYLFGGMVEVEDRQVLLDIIFIFTLTWWVSSRKTPIACETRHIARKHVPNHSHCAQLTLSDLYSLDLAKNDRYVFNTSLS